MQGEPTEPCFAALFVTISVLACTLGDGRRKCFSPSQTSATGNASSGRHGSPEKRGAANSRNLWARERLKAHTRRCRENFTRQNLQHVTRGRDSDAADVSDAGGGLTFDTKLPISELSVDMSLLGSGSTPKSSPASFSDVGVKHLFAIVFFVIISAEAVYFTVYLVLFVSLSCLSVCHCPSNRSDMV